MRPHLLLTINIVALISASALVSYLLQNNGLSATSLLIILVTAALITHIFTLFKRQQKQAEMVIRALANGDSTLGLGQQHPMRQQFEQVKTQMQTARFNAEQQAQFLQALLIHVDLAVMVCDDNGKVIESNPAVSKLLGKSFQHLRELGAVGELILNAKNNMRSTTYWQNGEQHDTLSIQLSIAEIQGKVRRVVSLQSIHDQLQLKEQQAYKRLTKVLTHEIANSITPLSSLADTCSNLLPQELCFIDIEDKQDLQLALSTLASRTAHLGDFIARFRQVSSLPKPNLAPENLADMLARIVTLHQQQSRELQINIELTIKSQQLVMLDSSQIEQVLVNLIKNAFEVLSSNKKYNAQSPAQPNIKLSLAQNASQQLYVEVSDNGPGISEHVVDMIFVPFFTTKQQGSGIGLSLSRQIMLNHGGDLIYVPKPQGACFRCVFG
ncbi:MAG: two-component system nitrogen regulation sensor histidine kinase NtrY [Pseudoalteromonas rhizosphaerae]|jgi:two-component system nitrogen regulation sensor histidine kinase NtrY|uniref:sensor histidine kinase n=1 Tax=Pseudoalteromonas TaxID=53246 RepID=UPI001601F9A7|nr:MULTISPECIES: ATP-binding protein [unclassified Pseudoalteromonas]MBB1292311.1 histidine kinase [Pseudoalteromonas sp. SR41-4]MBB1504864.1 histidine kinase [Pseudoalteromonas sp. SG41-1]